MSNGNSALPLALGAGGGLLLWYFLRDDKRDARASAPSPTALSANQAPPSSPVNAPTPASPAAPPSAPNACALRLDAAGLTADGARVGVVDAVNRCKPADRAEVTVSEKASGTVYADLMVALGRAGIAVNVQREATSTRNARRTGPRTVGDVYLPSFAQMVEALAGEVEPDPTPDGRARGRFGDRKVFIAAIRRELRGTWYGSLPRAAIDELLLRAHRERLLVLARADLVAAMDPDEVRDSEIVTDGAEFHFVTIEPDKE